MRSLTARLVVVLWAAAIWPGAGMAISGDAAPHTVAQRTADAPTFTRNVAPIFYEKCVSCHRPGEVAPMPLITYRDVRPWARAIREKVSRRVMPPWHADRQYGTFRNDLSLTQREIYTITAWVDAGASEGDPFGLPALPKFPDGWQIGTPDQIFEMPVEYQVPASGTLDCQYFDVSTHFTEDRWMQEGEVRAGDRAHVHHIIVYVREPDPGIRPNVVSVRPILAAGQAPPAAAPRSAATETASRRGAAPGGRDAMLVNWAVGEDAPVHAKGTAKRIPAGSTLVFQVHYTTNGKPGVDRSRLGLIFAKEPPAREVRTGMIANPLFAIPAGAANHEVEAEATFSDEVKIWSMHPHMHLRGKDMTYTAIYPDGRSEIMLRVPKFDFGWQTDYWLAEPLTLPKGSKLHVRAHFDNSSANRSNPDPSKVVRWGDQTWEEMMIGFFTYTVEGPAAQRSAR